MKKIFLFILTSLFVLPNFAQEIVGDWSGVLKIQSVELRIVLHIKKEENIYSATMDSPDQGAKGIPVTKVGLNGTTMIFEVETAGIKYEGNVEDETLIKGTFNQVGQSFPLDFVKQEGEMAKAKRPQEPKPPFPYASEEVSFVNLKASIKLAGTLTYPTEGSKFPAVILITGSGPQNRDEEIFEHKPFAVIADYLTRNGIAVLRYDDRGVAESEGDQASATSADFATDVEAAVEFLKANSKINAKRISLIGHSEGGMIAPMVAAESDDVASIVLLAGPGMLGSDLLILQTKLITEAYGVDDEKLKSTIEINKGAMGIVLEDNSMDTIKNQLTEYFRAVVESSPEMVGGSQEAADGFVKAHVQRMANPWMKYFLAYDPSEYLSKVKCPVLALNGEKDLQVPPNENIELIREILDKAGNNDFKTVIIPNLNHLFQECETGLPLEYGKIEQTFSPDALKLISDWILTH